MEPKQVDVSTLGVSELKALVYDLMKQRDQLNTGIAQIENIIAIRSQPEQQNQSTQTPETSAVASEVGPKTSGE